MPILNLHVKNIGPIVDLKFQFDENVNVFVGPNNSGKSTILTALAELAIFPFSFPQKLIREKPATFTFAYKTNGQKKKKFFGHFPISNDPELAKFWTEARWKLWEKFLEKLEFAIFVPAIRQSTDFRSEGPLTNLGDKSEGETYFDSIGDISLRQRKRIKEREISHAQKHYSPNMAARIKASFSKSAYLMKDEDLIQKMIELDYRAYRKKDTSLQTLVEKIASVVSDITSGYPIKFVGIGEDNSGLFPEFETPDGILPLNFLSQGTQSLVQSLARVFFGFSEFYGYSKNFEKTRGILIIDEIDAHLHPSWQRNFLPALTKHFPNYQIFCSTHSPLVLGGLKAGQIHLLQRNAEEGVSASTNKSDIIGWSADEVLRSILDVSVTTDIETEKMLNRLHELQERQRLSAKEKSELSRLRKKVNAELLFGEAEAQYKKIKSLLSADAKQQPANTSKAVKRKKVISKEQKITKKRINKARKKK